jgi:hypothetical protein
MINKAIEKAIRRMAHEIGMGAPLASATASPTSPLTGFLRSA